MLLILGECLKEVEITMQFLFENLLRSVLSPSGTKEREWRETAEGVAGVLAPLLVFESRI